MLSKISVDSPATLPISVARAKQRLNIDTADFDADLEALLRTAIAAVEHDTGRVIWPSTWEERVDCWPGCSPIEIPLAPVRNVIEIAYLDVTGAEQMIGSSNWRSEETPTGVSLWFVSGYSFPTLLSSWRGDRVRVRLTAGYDGSTPALTLDPRLEADVLFRVGTWHKNREHVQTEQQFEVPDTSKSLASQLRIYR